MCTSVTNEKHELFQICQTIQVQTAKLLRELRLTTDQREVMISRAVPSAPREEHPAQGFSRVSRLPSVALAPSVVVKLDIEMLFEIPYLCGKPLLASARLGQCLAGCAKRTLPGVSQLAVPAAPCAKQPASFCPVELSEILKSRSTNLSSRSISVRGPSDTSNCCTHSVRGRLNTSNCRSFSV